MEDFSFCNQGRLLFGEGKAAEFAMTVADHTRCVMLLCGSHFEKSGELEALAALLRKHGVRVVPRVMKSSTFAELAHDTAVGCGAGIGGVIGAGGAMVMDMAKLLAYAMMHPDEVTWSLFKDRSDAAEKKLFTATVPTYPSSGSELDGATEIVNGDTGESGGFYGECLIPDLTWLNPRYTLSVSNEDLAYGMLASYVQTSLAYMNPHESPLAEWMGLGLLESIESNLRLALDDPEDLHSRGQLMLCSCLSGYGLPYMGKGEVDFSLYTLEGYLEEACGLSYTRSLVTLFPFWLLHAVHAPNNRDNKAFERYCRACFCTRESAFSELSAKWQRFKIPLTLDRMSPQVEFDLEKFRAIAQKGGDLPCSFGRLTPDELTQIAAMASGCEF